MCERMLTRILPPLPLPWPQVEWNAEVIFYTHAKKDVIFKHVLETADAYVHRINPGNLKDEGKYFDMLRDLIKAGVIGLPNPDAMLKVPTIGRWVMNGWR